MNKHRRYDFSEKGQARTARYESSEKARARKRKWKQNKIDTDPIWRIEHYLKTTATNRARRLRELAERVERNVV